MSPRLLLGIAATAVCALLVALWMMIDGSEPAPAPAPAVAGPGTGDAPAPAPSAHAAAADSSARRAWIAPAASPAGRPVAPEAPVLEAPTAPDPATTKQLDMRRLVKAQVIATEQLLIDCIDRAGKAATKLEGTAAFPFTISRKAGKIVVESPGADYTTIGDPAVLDCMRDATVAMKLDELPEGVDRITGYRKVVVKDGALIENWMGPHEVTPAGR